MPIKPEDLKEPTIKEKEPQITAAEKQKVEVEKEIRAKEVLEAEQAYRRGLITIRDLIAPSAMRVDPKCLQLGDRYLRTIFVTTFPRYISVGCTFIQ